ncbi:MAG: hypothetical protein K2L37_04755, partial [Lactobacillus sp.]|nr:hypothetical protein [Lactobacillus sp.]
NIRGDISHDLQDSMERLNSRMDADKLESNSHDVELEKSISHIQSEVNDISLKVCDVAKTTRDVEDNLEILFEGENNEFRVYITQIHKKYVGTSEPLPRDLKQQLRIRYGMYKKRGGNGWAEDMYNEIMNSDIDNE